MVIGAPSEKNHLEVSEIETAKEILGERLVLVPGVSAQGGDCKEIIRIFGDLAMINVGRLLHIVTTQLKKLKSIKINLMK